MANQKSCKDHTEASLRNFKEQNFVAQNSSLKNFTEQNFTSNGENSSQNIKRPRQELSENKNGDAHRADEADTDAACSNETAYGSTCSNDVDVQAQSALPACAEVLRARLSERFARGDIFATLQGANRDNVRNNRNPSRWWHEANPFCVTAGVYEQKDFLLRSTHYQKP